MIRQQCMQFGMPLPDALKNPPELMPGLDFYLNAFYALNSCRSVGMALGPIPWTSMMEYAKMYCTTEDSTEDLLYHVKNLDETYLNWIAESNKAKTK